MGTRPFNAVLYDPEATLYILPLNLLHTVEMSELFEQVGATHVFDDRETLATRDMPVDLQRVKVA